MPVSIPEPDVILLLDNDLGDVEADDVDHEDQLVGLTLILLLTAILIRRILAEPPERHRELFIKLAGWIERRR